MNPIWFKKLPWKRLRERTYRWADLLPPEAAEEQIVYDLGAEIREWRFAGRNWIWIARKYQLTQRQVRLVHKWKRGSVDYYVNTPLHAVTDSLAKWLDERAREKAPPQVEVPKKPPKAAAPKVLSEWGQKRAESIARRRARRVEVLAEYARERGRRAARERRRRQQKLKSVRLNSPRA